VPLVLQQQLQLLLDPRLPCLTLKNQYKNAAS